MLFPSVLWLKESSDKIYHTLYVVTDPEVLKGAGWGGGSAKLRDGSKVK